MKKTFVFALLALLTLSFAVTAQETRKIKIGVEGAYPPFSQIGTDGKLKGFDIDIANAMLSRAADLSTDLIVMGAYGHARWTERVLGGATRGLLATMTVPVLMSH